MRIAIAIAHRDTAREIVDTAIAAEAAGLDEVWLAEDLGQRGAIALVSTILASTTTLRVGIGVLNPVTRHPHLIAMEAASLAELYPGRVDLGLGTGSISALRDLLGIDRPRPLSDLITATRLVRSALAGAGADGGTVRGPALSYPPAVPPTIVWGVKGPRAIAASTDEADGLLLSMLTTPAYVADVRCTVGDRLHLAAYVLMAPGPGRDADLRSPLARLIGMQDNNAMMRASGLPPPTIGAVKAQLRRADRSGSALSNEEVAHLAICGSPSDRTRRIAEFASAGLDTLVVRGVASQPLHEFVAAAADLIPLLPNDRKGSDELP